MCYIKHKYHYAFSASKFGKFVSFDEVFTAYTSIFSEYIRIYSIPMKLWWEAKVSRRVALYCMYPPSTLDWAGAPWPGEPRLPAGRLRGVVRCSWHVSILYLVSVHNVHMSCLPENQHLGWVRVTFLGDFSSLSWAYFLCNQAEILICCSLSLLQCWVVRNSWSRVPRGRGHVCYLAHLENLSFDRIDL